MARRCIYRCTECDSKFVFYRNSDDDAPDECPTCFEADVNPVSNIDHIIETGKFPGAKTDKSRAVDFAQTVAERDFGLSDINDNQRAGDMAFKPKAPPQTAERDAFVRDMLAVNQATEAQAERVQGTGNQFWGGHASPAVAQHIAGAQMGAEVARKDGVDPISMLHEAGAKGVLKTNYTIVGRA